jgi:hypothetical protein
MSGAPIRWVMVRASEKLPFDLKRKIMLKVVDKIMVNTREEWFEIEGVISDKFDIDPAGRDFCKMSTLQYRLRVAFTGQTSWLALSVS